jgi:hypothetical protein
MQIESGDIYVFILQSAICILQSSAGGLGMTKFANPATLLSNRNPHGDGVRHNRPQG